MALVFDCCDPNGNSERKGHNDGTAEIKLNQLKTQVGRGEPEPTRKTNRQIKTFGVDVLDDGGGIVAGANASNGLAGV